MAGPSGRGCVDTASEANRFVAGGEWIEAVHEDCGRASKTHLIRLFDGRQQVAMKAKPKLTLKIR